MRFGGSMPKQFQILGDMPVFLHSIKKFDTIGCIDGIVLVAPRDYVDHCQNLIDEYAISKIIDVVAGGKSRRESTYIGLNTITDLSSESIILVHDAARPFVNESEIKSLIAATYAYRAAILALPVSDTIKVVGAKNMVTDTLNREELFAAKTPQAAYFTDLLKAHKVAVRDGFDGTDDCQILENIGIFSSIVTTNAANIKITTAQDLDFAAFLLKRGMV